MHESPVTQAQPKGEGLLFVDATLWEDLGKPETPDAWHKALLLPESYEVERIEQPKPQSPYYALAVLSEHIPTDRAHIAQADIISHYKVDYVDGVRGRPYLDYITINLWDGEKWEEVTDRRETK